MGNSVWILSRFIQQLFSGHHRRGSSPFFYCLHKQALGLHPADRNGKADPYLVLSLGKVVIDERADYQPKALNPVFGKCYEFNAQLPQDSMLIIQVIVILYLFIAGLFLKNYIIQLFLRCYLLLA